MDERIKNHISKYSEVQGWGKVETDGDILEILRGENNLHREEVDRRRWWNVYQYTVEIDGMLIGYDYAEANRDESVYDLGYEFDPSTVCEMEKKEKTVIIYVPK